MDCGILTASVKSFVFDTSLTSALVVSLVLNDILPRGSSVAQKRTLNSSTTWLYQVTSHGALPQHRESISLSAFVQSLPY